MAENESTGLEAAAGRIRETAKWLTVSLAGIGAIMAAGLQLSDIGKLETGTDRFWLAIAGGVVAAIGATVVLYAARYVMTSPSVSLNTITQKVPAGAAKVVSDPTLLDGYQNVGALQDEYIEAVKHRKVALNAYLNNTADPDLRSAAERADVRAVTVNATARELLSVVSYENLAHRWRKAANLIVGGGLVGALGIGVFAWSASPPDDAVASAATPNVLTTPTAKKLTLTEGGIEALQSALGESCDGTMSIDVLVLGKTDAGPDVVTNQTATCARIRFILGATWGTVSD